MYKSLKSNIKIQKILKHGSKKRSHSFSIFVFEETDLQAPEVAFLAGKKVFKTAVIRNKVKRKLREAFRISELINKNYSFVIMPYISILDNTHSELIVEMNQTAERI